MTATQIGRYELRSTLARTQTSIVHEGWDGLIGRRVAIKVISAMDKDDAETREALIRFSRGAQAAGILNHPNIVAVYDYGETSDGAYLVMEFVDGVTLKTLLDRPERMTLAAVLRVVEDVLAALEYSHRCGVVHRDIKPANLMILADGRAKIADFGVARIENSNITQVGTIIGTPAYMSPEQFLGEPVDPRTDIYSTGAVLYQMLTGKRPFDGSVATIAHKVLHTDPPPPSQVVVGFSAEFDPVVRRAMARNRDDRYRSAQAFADAVRDAAAASSSGMSVRRVAVPPPSPRSDIRRPGPQNARAGRSPARLPILAGTAAGLAIGAIMLWAARPAIHGTVSQASRADAVQTERPPAQSVAALPPAPAPVPAAGTLEPPPPPRALADANDGTLSDSAPLPAPTRSSASSARVAGPALSGPVVPALIELAPGGPPALRDTVAVLPPLPKPPLPRTRPPPASPQVALATAPGPEVRSAEPAKRPRVYLFYPDRSSAGLGLSTNIAQRLLFSDFAYADTRSSTKAPAQSEIRFYRAEDQNAAERLATLLSDIGGGFQVRNLSDQGAAEPNRTLEIWIAR